MVQNASEHAGTPPVEDLISWVRKGASCLSGELTVRIVDEPESAELNRRFRGRSGATNVLAFPAGDMPAVGPEPVPLGDIVVCAPIVAREAQQQKKPLAAHWAHMLIHGSLHLQAYDHMTDIEAERMEARERELLAELGISDPYASLD